MSKRSDNVTRGIEKAPMRSLFLCYGVYKGRAGKTADRRGFRSQ